MSNRMKAMLTVLLQEAHSDHRYMGGLEAKGGLEALTELVESSKKWVVAWNNLWKWLSMLDVPEAAQPVFVKYASEKDRLSPAGEIVKTLADAAGLAARKGQSEASAILEVMIQDRKERLFLRTVAKVFNEYWKAEEEE